MTPISINTMFLLFFKHYKDKILDAMKQKESCLILEWYIV